MNPDYEQRLESRIDSELKSLPQLQAPAALQSRVLAAIAARAAIPLRSETKVWSLQARTTLFFGLAMAFAAAAYIVLQARGSGPVAELLRSSGGLYEVLTLVFGAAQTLVSAVALALKHLGTPVIAGLVAAAVLSYLTCIALGTLWYQVAFGTPARSR